MAASMSEASCHTAESTIDPSLTAPAAAAADEELTARMKRSRLRSSSSRRRSGSPPDWLSATAVSSWWCATGSPSGRPEAVSKSRTVRPSERSMMASESSAREALARFRNPVCSPGCLGVESCLPSYVYTRREAASASKKSPRDCTTSVAGEPRSKRSGLCQSGAAYTRHWLAVTTTRWSKPRLILMTRSRKSRSSSLVPARASCTATRLASSSRADSRPLSSSTSTSWANTTAPLPPAPATIVESGDHAKESSPPLPRGLALE
mmetsp:Transcript_5077/g.12375  ORF Transcript_5077/g.12375 Transcript_5077/m.12375 type:complete len:264 (+) Transcript_5077:1585-2376(+)